MRELLVIFHEATRTGSPVVAAQLLEHVKSDLEARIAVELLSGGPLEGRLRGLADVTAAATRPTAVLINSSLAAAEALRFDTRTPVSVYVHEQGEALRTLRREAIEALVDRVDDIWCVSDRSRQDLVQLGVCKERISVIPPVVKPAREVGDDELAAVSEDLGMPQGSRLVAACGEANWRKGADLFPDICRRLPDDDSLTFVWIGRRQRAFGRILDHDTRSLGLGERLIWIGEVDDPAPFLSKASLVVTPSREDPQPLVPLEASLYGTPTVGFASGGLADMQDAGAALTAAYPDTSELARQAELVLDDPDTATAMVTAAQTMVSRKHSMRAVGSTFLAHMNDLLDSKGEGGTSRGRSPGSQDGGP